MDQTCEEVVVQSSSTQQHCSISSNWVTCNITLNAQLCSALQCRCLGSQLLTC